MMRQTPAQEESTEAHRIDWPSWRQVLGWLALVLAVLAALGHGVKLYRRLAPRFARRAQLYRLGYRATLDRLAEIGVRRRFGESREGFAERGARLAPSFAPLTGEHLGWALGSRRSASPEVVGRLMTQVTEELRRAVPPWRRFVGLIDPTSWLRAR
jgi:hypothetical protein